MCVTGGRFAGRRLNLQQAMCPFADRLGMQRQAGLVNPERSAVLSGSLYETAFIKLWGTTLAEFFRSRSLVATCGAFAALCFFRCSLRSETASASRSRPLLARRYPSAALREVTPCSWARSRPRRPCRAHAFADTFLRPPRSTSRPRLGGGRWPNGRFQR
jgi:hypothetical protein